MIILIGHLVLMIAYLAISAYFYITPTSIRNHVFGYRTPASMRNDATWKEANRYAGKVQLKLCILFQALCIASYLSIGGATSFYICSGLLASMSIAVIPITELHLKKTFPC